MADIGSAALAVAEEMDARVYVYSGAIDGRGYAELVRSMQPNEQQPQRPNSVLVLTTNGGLANSAFQIARLLQNTSKEFHLAVPLRCKSAGTLLALGATHLIMSEIAELGPLDVQLLKTNEIGERKSGLVVRTAFDGLSDECCQLFDKIMMNIKVQGATISFDRASSIATEIVAGVMAPVYAQINPEILGSDLRDLRVATEYGNRLVEISKNAYPDTVDKLVSSYPSHDFIIDSTEAKELFRHVGTPSKLMTSLTRELGRLAYMEQAPHVIFRADKLPSKPEEKEAADEPDQKKSDGTGADPGLASVRRTDRKSDAAKFGPSGRARTSRQTKKPGSKVGADKN